MHSFIYGFILANLQATRCKRATARRQLVKTGRCLHNYFTFSMLVEWSSAKRVIYPDIHRFEIRFNPRFQRLSVNRRTGFSDISGQAVLTAGSLSISRSMFGLVFFSCLIFYCYKLKISFADFLFFIFQIYKAPTFKHYYFTGINCIIQLLLLVPLHKTEISVPSLLAKT